ncbi:hypothetical protein [Vibrio furnissii]|uniref:hypothetical protein n=1 Tax=Vibrio furnissii TaxID=29494 RepID=UPI001F4F6A4C|nr:hypothetical protein [Vibrio furnissii]
MRNRAFCALAVGVLSLQPFTTSRAQTISAATQIESYLTTVIETALYGQFSAFENPKINIRLAPAAQHLAPCATSLHADKKSPTYWARNLGGYRVRHSGKSKPPV